MPEDDDGAASLILQTTALGQGAPLVLLHGLFGAASNFGTVQRRLAEHYQVWALDLRNHGRSPHAPRMDYRTMAADVAETLTAQNVGPAAVLGHSMGGKAAMALALTAPHAVTRLLVADIAPARYEPHFRKIAAAMQSLPLTPGLTRAGADEALRSAVPDPSVRGFLLQNLRFGAQPAWRIGLDEIADALPDIEGWDAAGRFEGPVLSLGGERSDYVLPQHRPAFRALFPAVKFATLHDAGHWLHADAPEAFLAAVLGFMA